jgi:uncharacterized protein involved in exopolysaccharide biosynthesis
MERKDTFTELLGNWRLWLLGALVGAVLGGLAYQVFPPDYRARATVVMDLNLEESWQLIPDRELFQLTFRETEKLEALAWSDAVLSAVAAEAGDVSLQTLRSDVLQLSQPADGAWRFYADHPDAARAEAIAAAWAEHFVAAVQAARTVSADLEAARAQLSAMSADGAAFSDIEVQRLFQEINFLLEHSEGISFYTDPHLSQSEGILVGRAPSQASYLLAGSAIGALGLALLSLLGLWPVRKA